MLFIFTLGLKVMTNYNLEDAHLEEGRESSGGVFQRQLNNLD